MVAMSEAAGAQVTIQEVAGDGRDVDPITGTRYEEIIISSD